MSIQRSGRATGRFAAIAALGLSLIALAACETAPIYRPRGPNDVVGYTDEQLTPTRYRVTFTGGTGTRREEVEDYLLRRAAEVTLQAGYADFKFDIRDTKDHTYYRTMFGPRPGFAFGGRFGPRPWYWSSFAFHDPLFYDPDVIPVTRYSAYSEIVMLTAEQAANDPEAISARDILNRLAPPKAPPPPPGT
jgi:hypothetical protein